MYSAFHVPPENQVDHGHGMLFQYGEEIWKKLKLNSLSLEYELSQCLNFFVQVKLSHPVLAKLVQ